MRMKNYLAMAKHNPQLTEKIKKYLLANPEKLNADYAQTAELFGVNYEQIRGIARRLRENWF